MTAISIPAGLSGLTPGWLTAALREAGVLDSARVRQVATQVIGEDRGFTGVVARLQLGYDRASPSAPASVVAKFPLAGRSVESGYRAAQAADPQRTRAYLERCAREVSFYRLAAPQTPLAPRAYFARADLDAGRILLLIEDLSDGEVGDALRGCSTEQARDVVESLAAFHAQWWERPALFDFDCLPRWASDPVASAERYRSQAGPFLDAYGERIPPGVRDLVTLLRDGYEAVLRALNEPPVTMIHADLHLDNLIFMPAAGGQPVKVIDWQSVACGRGVVDLALFIAGSLETGDRRGAELGLLRRYHRIVGAAGVPGYNFDDLLAGYRLGLLWQLAGTVGWLSRTRIDALAGRERQLVEAIFTDRRLFNALEDHEAELRKLI